jgi:hypothetical protein
LRAATGQDSQRIAVEPPGAGPAARRNRATALELPFWHARDGERGVGISGGHRAHDPPTALKCHLISRKGLILGTPMLSHVCHVMRPGVPVHGPRVTEV